MQQDVFRLLLLFFLFNSFKALSVVPINPGVTVHGDMQGENLMNYYVLNVTGATSTTRMTVLLHKIGGGRDSGLLLSVCYDQLPCGDLGCGCPRHFVDPAPAEGSDDSVRRRSIESSSDLRVDISPCELKDGLWYISVELPTSNEGGESNAAAFYDLTASLSDARLVLGQVTSDS
jgi:hypothetical protein